MPNDSPRKNPLTATVIGLLIGEVYAVYRWWETRSAPDLFALVAVIHAAVLATLYFRRSPAAGAFLFYSVIPIYPLYLFATYEGWYSPPLPPSLYPILLAMWGMGIWVVWREKRKYDQYIAPAFEASRDPAEPPH
jgi:hypothetical protein